MDEHRADSRGEMIAAATIFYERGWMRGTAGNLSARADDNSFWITASGVSKGRLGPKDFVRIGLDGELIEAEEDRRPSAETSIHQVLYATQPQVGAVYHVHTVETNVLTAKSLAPLWLPALEMLKGFGFYENRPIDVEVFENHTEVPRIADEMAEWLNGGNPRIPAMVIKDHGLTTWAPDPETAFHYVELLDYIFRFMVASRGA